LMDPAAFRRDLHPGRVAASVKPTLSDVFGRRASALEGALVRTLLEGAATVDRIVELVWVNRQPENGAKRVHGLVSSARKKLRREWHILSETDLSSDDNSQRRYRLVRR